MNSVSRYLVLTFFCRDNAVIYSSLSHSRLRAVDNLFFTQPCVDLENDYVKNHTGIHSYWCILIQNQLEMCSWDIITTSLANAFQNIIPLYF